MLLDVYPVQGVDTTLNNGPLNTLLNFQSQELLRGNVDFACLNSTYWTEILHLSKWVTFIDIKHRNKN